MKQIYILLLSALVNMTASAQVINGDLNHNNNLDVGDVTLLIDGYLTGETETIVTEIDHYAVQNSMVAGTWYSSTGDSLILNADGTTNYAYNCTYRFMPSQGCILFFNEKEEPFISLKVSYITDQYLAILPANSEFIQLYTAHTHEYIDLGLSVKWATMNIGASAPEENGDYFVWGGAHPRYKWQYFGWEDYKWCNGSRSTLTKYCTKSYCGTVDNKTQLELADDAASANWGGKWRMPTDAELTELREKCTWTWTSINGVNGMNVTGPSGNSIFLPAAGYCSEESSINDTRCGYYWSSSLWEAAPYRAWYVSFDSGGAKQSNEYRYRGQSVRAVCP